MEKRWEDMTADEKLESLRQSIENLRIRTAVFIGQIEDGQRGLNDRIVKLEQALKR